jgi:hypothetical protein
LINFFFSPHFFPGWILALFFGHSSFTASTGILRISHLFIGIFWTSLNQHKFALSAAFVVFLLSLQPHLPAFWCQSFKASIAFQRLPLHGIDTRPFSRFFSQNFFFLLDIYRPDGRTLRHFTMMTRTLTKRTELHGWTNKRCAFLLSYDLTTHTMHFIGYPHESHDEYYSYRYSHHRIFSSL